MFKTRGHAGIPGDLRGSRQGETRSDDVYRTHTHAHTHDRRLALGMIDVTTGFAKRLVQPQRWLRRGRMCVIHAACPVELGTANRPQTAGEAAVNERLLCVLRVALRLCLPVKQPYMYLV